MKLLRDVFQLYNTLSGQSVNWAKFEVFFSKSVTANRRSFLSGIVGIRVGCLPFTYLGVFLFVGAPRMKFLKPIYDRIISKFCKWKGKSLSMAGRLELINSVISGSCLHSFFIYKWPQELILKLNRCMRNFLWNGCIEEKKLITISWERCCKSKKAGGLGIKNLSNLNLAMLRKLCWSLISKSFLFEGPRQRFLSEAGTPKISAISSSWSSIKRIYADFQKDCIWHFGSSSKLSFWYDYWISPPLAQRLQLPLNSNVLASDFVCYYWNDGWSELDNLSVNLQQDIGQITGGLEEEDRYFWTVKRFSIFTVKACYNYLQNYVGLNAFHNVIWQAFIPPSRSILCWKVLNRKVPTHDVLRLKGMKIVSRCFLCKASDENIDHLFWNCVFAREMWHTLAGIFSLLSPVLILFTTCFGARFARISVLRYGIYGGLAQLVLFGSYGIRETKLVLRILNLNIRNMFRQLWGFIRKATLCISSTVFNRWSDFNLLRQLRLEGRRPKAPRLTEIIWNPPSYGWIKVNTDGAALGAPGMGGGGGIFRTSRGFPLGSFAFNLSNCFAFLIELKSAMKVISLAWERGWKKLWLEVDSIYVVNIFRKRSGLVPLEVRNDWLSCLQLLSKMNFIISHIYREGNQAADALSKHGLQLNGFLWWPSCPSFCATFVGNDICNRPNYRFS